MPNSDTPQNPVSPWWKDALLALGLFGLVMACFFSESFEQNKVVFANDAPLGQIQAHAADEKNGWAFWQDLNWVGGEAPSAMPNFTKAFFELCLWQGGDQGAVLFAKWYQPVSLVLLGFCAWVFFRALRFRQPVCLLGGLAAALNGDFFTYATWGLPSVALGASGAFLAMAAVIHGLRETGWRMVAWVVLGGLGLGQGVMESFDVGGIFSLYVAVFVLMAACNRNETERGAWGVATAKGVGLVVVLAVASALMAGHALSNLLNTEGKAAAAQQQQFTDQQQWNFATQWSLPKAETARLAVPGLFGYRLDSAEGARYWGAVGQSPGWQPGQPGLPRHSGYGIYAGMLVLLVSLWALVQASFGSAGRLETVDRRWVIFWVGLVVLSVLFAWGRHAPFYQMLYPMPFFNSIRNPIKFMHPASLGLVVLFAYGLEGMARAYMEKKRKADFFSHLKQWWGELQGLDRRLCQGLIGCVLLGVLVWVFYAAVQSDLKRHLTEGLQMGGDSVLIAQFSLKMMGAGLITLVTSVGVMLLIISGVWGGRAAHWTWAVCGLLLAVDFGRAHARYLVHENYAEKYETNAVLNVLARAPHQQRVKIFPGQFAARLAQSELMLLQQQFQDTNRTDQVQIQLQMQNLMQQFQQVQLFNSVYTVLWAQHHFPYYQIQSADIIQEPRVAADNRAYREALAADALRLCELTSSRYLLGLGRGGAAHLDSFYGQEGVFDERLHFGLGPKKQGQEVRTVEDVQATAFTNGPLALIDFKRALPRAGLYAQWRSGVEDGEVLATLPQKIWDPHREVLISERIPAPESQDGNATVVPAQYESYDPKRIVLKTRSDTSTVLLLNDKHHPAWRVTVDGQPAELLRANYLMRGVHLPAGAHTVEFLFAPSEGSIRVSLAGFGLGALVVGLLILGPRRKDRGKDSKGPSDDPETSTVDDTSSPDEPKAPSRQTSRSRSGRRKKR